LPIAAQDVIRDVILPHNAGCAEPNVCMFC
jgi:hypothetical protein